MRRIVLVLILVAVVGFAGFMLLKPKGSARSSKRAAATVTDSTGSVRTAASKGKSAAKPARRGKTTGALKPMTKEERKAEVKRRREEERRRRKALKQQERERKRALKAAGRLGRSSKRSSKGQYYVVKAIVSLGHDSYALIDGRRAQVGDVVMGRRIVSIEPDRIEVEAFGRQSTVRVGESLLPSSYGGSGSTRRQRRLR